MPQLSKLIVDAVENYRYDVITVGIVFNLLFQRDQVFGADEYLWMARIFGEMRRLDMFILLDNSAMETSLWGITRREEEPQPPLRARSVPCCRWDAYETVETTEVPKGMDEAAATEDTAVDDDKYVPKRESVLMPPAAPGNGTMTPLPMVPFKKRSLLQTADEAAADSDEPPCKIRRSFEGPGLPFENWLDTMPAVSQLDQEAVNEQVEHPSEVRGELPASQEMAAKGTTPTRASIIVHHNGNWFKDETELVQNDSNSIEDDYEAPTWE